MPKPSPVSPRAVDSKSKQGKGPVNASAKPVLALGSHVEREKFTRNLMAWGVVSGRVGLPWQVADAYKIWVSEIMLQQTQVETVKPYFEKFIGKWPTPTALANSSLDEVLAAWAGLGYYRRAKFLHKSAQIIRDSHAGIMPKSAAELAALPGIGRSTAAAISSLSENERVAIMDGNVQRVIARHWAFGDNVATSRSQKTLWATAEALVDVDNARLYTQTIMDLGATVCMPKNPNCIQCPLAISCKARELGKQTSFPIKIKSDKPRRVDVEVWRIWFDGRRVAMVRNDADTGVWQSLHVFARDDALMTRMSTNVLDCWSFKHVFSHYDLHVDVEIHRVEPKGLDEQVDERGWSAFGVDEALKLGIPTPVKAVLQRVASSGFSKSKKAM